MKKKMIQTRGSRIWLLTVLLILGICIAVPLEFIFAGKTITVETTTTLMGPPPTILPAGDDKDHIVGLGKRKGKTVFADGRIAQYSNVFFLDLHRKKGASVTGYTKMVFKDGSWLFFKWKAKSVGRDKNGNPKMAGEGVILQGTGVYKGIQGSAKFTNRRLLPSKKYPKGATVAKAVLKYTLP